MGKLKQGILGGFTGKVANVTGSSWKGISVVKSRPLSVAYPGTAGQVAQTNKMSGCVAFAITILSYWIKPLWDRFAVQMSGYNAFVRANIAEFSDGVINDYANLVMTAGKMQAIPFEAEVTGGGNDVTLDWSQSEVQDNLALPTDVAFAIVVNETTDVMMFGGAATRFDEGVVITGFNNISTGDVLHCWVAFKAANGTRVSNTSYTKLIVPAP